MLNRAVEKHPKIVARILKKRKSICTIGSRRARSCALRCSEQQISFHAHHLTSFDLETKKYGSDMKVSLKLSSSICSTWKFTGEKCLDNIYHFLFAFSVVFLGGWGIQTQNIIRYQYSHIQHGLQIHGLIYESNCDKKAQFTTEQVEFDRTELPSIKTL
jgi:hypothetical protein